MSERIEVASPIIAPIYSQSQPNQPIDLGQVAIRFDRKGKTYDKTANAAIRFVPDDRLEFVCPLEGESSVFALQFVVDADPVIRLTLADRGVSFDVLCGAVGGKDNTIVFEPKQSGVTVTPACQDIAAATFHLFNFPDFRGPENYILLTGEPPLQGSKVCGRVVLNTDGWNITIAATGQTDDLTKSLKAQGGYVVTHMGKIKRWDGSTFSSKQLDDLLSCLQHFLSFVLGRWAGLALPIGFNAMGSKVFEQWGLPIIADGAWNGSSSWFDRQHGELLSQVFPGFVSLWANEVWRKPLTHALYWCLGACDRRVGIGVDTGTILAQNALELLAWTYCVLDRKMVSPRAFKRGGLSAADKLRFLASSLEIPKEIPSGLGALHAKKGETWIDGMDAITGIRNSLVHPDSRVELPEGSYYDGWRLSLWYIDMVLLRLCGHTGEYANRLAERWVGQVESVPWAKKDEAKP